MWVILFFVFGSLFYCLLLSHVSTALSILFQLYLPLLHAIFYSLKILLIHAVLLLSASIFPKSENKMIANLVVQFYSKGNCYCIQPKPNLEITHWIFKLVNRLSLSFITHQRTHFVCVILFLVPIVFAFLLCLQFFCVIYFSLKILLIMLSCCSLLPSFHNQKIKCSKFSCTIFSKRSCFCKLNLLILFRYFVQPQLRLETNKYCPELML